MYYEINSSTNVNKCVISALKIFAGIALSTQIFGKIKYAIFASWIAYFLLGAVMIIFLRFNPRFKLVNTTWSSEDLWNQIDSSIRDLFILLPCAVYLNQRYSISRIVLDDDGESDFYQSPWRWALIPVGVFAGLIWRMLVHRLLHLPKIYRQCHKIHHLQAPKMTPFSTFNDHPVEFILMEIIGTFFLPAIIQPLPVPILTFLWALQCALGILDHSNARIPYICDSSYHLTHHQVNE